MKKRERIGERYRENSAMLPVHEDYIFDQNAAEVRSLRYGEKYSVDYNGCGAIAVHNVMKHIGRTQNFIDVLRELEELHLLWLGGAFGTKPWALGRYFQSKKIPYRKYKSPNDFKAALLTHQIGVVCTWNKRFRGMHFYCVYYSLKENKYYTANLHTPSSEFVPADLQEMINYRFIIGYAVQNPVIRTRTLFTKLT